MRVHIFFSVIQSKESKLFLSNYKKGVNGLQLSLQIN